MNVDVSVMNNMADVEGIYPWDSNHKVKFPETRRIEMKQSSQSYMGDLSILKINVKYDIESTYNFKQVYTLTDMMSQVGGLFNSVLFIGKAAMIIFFHNYYICKML